MHSVRNNLNIFNEIAKTKRCYMCVHWWKETCSVVVTTQQRVCPKFKIYFISIRKNEHFRNRYNIKSYIDCFTFLFHVFFCRFCICILFQFLTIVHHSHNRENSKRFSGACMRFLIFKTASHISTQGLSEKIHLLWTYGSSKYKNKTKIFAQFCVCIPIHIGYA